MRVSCAGLKHACHTQWDWRPSWSRGCGVAPLPRDLQKRTKRNGQGLLPQLSLHRQKVQARAGQSVLGCWRCSPGTCRLAEQAAEYQANAEIWSWGWSLTLLPRHLLAIWLGPDAAPQRSAARQAMWLLQRWSQAQGGKGAGQQRLPADAACCTSLTPWGLQATEGAAGLKGRQSFVCAIAQVHWKHCRST